MEAKESGSTRFCMGAAWREVRDNRDFDKVIEMVKGVSTMGLEVCCTLGMLTPEQAQKLKKNVPYKVSKQLVELFGALGTTSWSSLRWRAVVHHVGNRTGLVLCGDLKTATSIVVRESGTLTNGNSPSADDVRRLASSYEPLRELLRFALSEDHFLLREKVGTAIGKIASA